jgi:hypothetical protein
VYPHFNLATEPFALAETPDKIHKHDAKREDHQILHGDMRSTLLNCTHLKMQTMFDVQLQKIKAMYV